MTILDVANFYFNKYDKLEIVIEKWKGITTKKHLFTKESFAKITQGWWDKEVISVSFQTHYTNTFTKEIEKCEYPYLYMLIY